jgi:hypothetical protein
MTKHEFQLPDGSLLVSVVMSEEEFSEMCDFIKELLIEKPPVNVAQGERMKPEHVEAIREAKHLPMIARGTLTEPVFDKYGISTDKASFIVRGQGENVFFRNFGS